MTATHGEGAYGNAVGVTTPTEHKMAQVADFVKTGVNTIRAGLLWDGNATVITGKSNMSYDVRAFSIVTSRSATAGAMKWANDATLNVVTTAAPGSNSRYDVVYAWHREFSLGDTDSDPVIGVIQGTSAASPTVPALTSFPGAVELARILVPAGVTATNSGTTITQTAPFTAASGGVVAVRNTTERDAGTWVEGTLIELLDWHTVQQYTGSGWNVIAGDSGWQTLAPAANWTATATIQYRKIGNTVFVRGGPTKSTTPTTAESMSAALPVGYRPSTIEPIAAVHGSGAPCAAGVQSTGVISAYPASGGGNQVIFHGYFIAEA